MIQIENCKLYQGNCLQVMQQLKEEKIQVSAVIADIPYFQVVKESFDNQWQDEDDYLKWVEESIFLFKQLLKPNASIILFTGRQFNRKIATILDKYFDEKRIIVWARKRAFNKTRGKALASGYEPICYYTQGKNTTFNNLKIKVKSDRKEYTKGYLKDGISLSDVWTDIPALPHNSKEKVNHPTQKPIKLMERCILMTTNEKDTILDFVMGSGTTGIATIRNNRNFIGIEVDKKYFDIAANRIKEENENKNRTLWTI